VGHNDNADISITNSLFAPIEASSNKITNGSTFVNGGSATLINCYYTETMGSAQGSQVSTISAGDGVTVAIADAVSSEYSISGLSFYTTGVLYDNKIWAANNTEVSLNLDGTIYGHTITGFTPSAGTLTGSANPYTLTMPNSNVTINAASWTSNELPGTGTLKDPYTISNDTEWEDFCVNSWGGNNYSGKYVELKNDISATEMAGASETYSFQGICLGNGHTLTFTRGSSQDLFGKLGIETQAVQTKIPLFQERDDALLDVVHVLFHIDKHVEDHPDLRIKQDRHIGWALLALDREGIYGNTEICIAFGLDL
jgi:hypothetical protein